MKAVETEQRRAAACVCLTIGTMQTFSQILPDLTVSVR